MDTDTMTKVMNQTDTDSENNHTDDESRPPAPAPKKPNGKQKKRTLIKIMEAIPNVKDVKFDPLDTSTKREAILRIPPNIDMEDPYALFSLFWPENMWGIISRNTSMYAVIKRFTSTAKRQRTWWETSNVQAVFNAGLQWLKINVGGSLARLRTLKIQHRHRIWLTRRRKLSVLIRPHSAVNTVRWPSAVQGNAGMIFIKFSLNDILSEAVNR
jgi:hypothetical protein